MIVHRGLLGLSTLKAEIRQWKDEEELCKTGIIQKLLKAYHTVFPILQLHSLLLLQLLAQKLNKKNFSFFFTSQLPDSMFAEAISHKGVIFHECIRLLKTMKNRNIHVDCSD
jgi:hypothetical protein